MTAIGFSERRNVVPRLRRTSAALGAADAKPLREVKKEYLSGGVDYDSVYREWKSNPIAGILVDLISIAVVERRTDHAAELSRALEEQGDRVPSSVQELGFRYFGHREQVDATVDRGADLKSVMVARDPAAIRGAISSLKSRLSTLSRNPCAWHDLAYFYNLLGQTQKAKRAMLAAVESSYGHRFFSRSASRLFLHQGDSDLALSLLKRSDGFRSDPWLLSAHISVSQAAGMDSRFLSLGRSISSVAGVNSIEHSELRTALATYELREGSLKKSRVLLKNLGQSVTENALAQAVWLGPRLGGDLVSHKLVEITTDAFEAQAWDAFFQSRWKESLNFSEFWAEDEPFSERPALHGSFVAATFLKDFELSKRFAEFGLTCNPLSWMLRNNLAVALAALDDLEGARFNFKMLEVPEESDSRWPTWIATKGLIKYRAGNVAAGREDYLAARSKLKESRSRVGLIIAATFQSTEEVRIGNLEESAKIISEVHQSLNLSRSSGQLLDSLPREISSIRSNSL